MRVDDCVMDLLNEIQRLIEVDEPMPPSKVMALDRLQRECVKYLEATK